MNEENKLPRVKIILGLIILLAVFIAVRWYVSVEQETFLTVANTVIAEQEERMDRLVNTLNTSNQPEGEFMVADCSKDNRIRFDGLLSNLSKLNRAELLELDTLFGGCAYHFSTIQAFKAAQLKRELAVYEDMLQSVAVIDNDAEKKLENIDKWETLVSKAEEMSLLVAELVEIQGNIIELLLAYNSINSSDVQELVSRGQEIRENIVFLNQEIGRLHKEN